MKRRFASLLGALVLLTGAVMMAGCPQSAKPDIQKYKITLKAGDHGTIAANPVLPKDGMVEQYTTLTFTATPNADYETEWAGAVPDADDKNKATLTVTADTMVTVTFKKRGSAAPGGNGQATETPNGFHIALSSGEHGSVQADSALPADGIVAKNTVLIFTATPDVGYEVDTWTGATQDSTDKNKATLTVTAHTTVSVTFKEKTVDSSLLQIESDGTLRSITDKNALAGSLVIPNTVTKIGDNAFEGCSKLTSVTMPETVTEIGFDAFKGCSKLTNVTIGSDVTSIGQNAFQNCPSLTTITIPDKVTSIGNEAFQNCIGLTTLTIGKGVSSISTGAFAGCSSLERITINSTSLNSIEENAFVNCTGLTSLTIGKSVANINFISSYSLSNINTVTVDPENLTYCSVDNIIYKKDKTKLIFALPSAVSGEFTIPDSVTEIGESAFANCHALSAVTIGARVTKIGNWAFSECHKLTSIAIPDSVTEIGGNAFAKCPELTAVTLGNRVTKIGEGAFTGCHKFTDITIPDSVTEIGFYAFGSCDRLTSAVFKEPSGWKVLSKDGNTTENINQADLEDTSKAATYLRDTYWEYTWQKQ